jgi:hypothetical protein
MPPTTRNDEPLLSAVLICSKRTDFIPERVLRRFGLADAVVWHTGEHSLSGRVKPDSGFRICVGEYASSEGLSTGLRDFLECHHDLFRALQEEGADVRIDILVPIAVPRDAARCISLDARLLELAGSSGVGLDATACVIDDQSVESSQQGRS